MLALLFLFLIIVVIFAIQGVLKDEKKEAFNLKILIVVIWFFIFGVIWLFAKSF